jgi:hypothetical protein
MANFMETIGARAMSIRFAAARPIGCRPTACARVARVSLGAANDNGLGQVAGSNRLLKAALRHFAEHGLSVAEQARNNAEQAFFAGQTEEYRWWLAICSALDRRMAAAIEFHGRALGK